MLTGLGHCSLHLHTLILNKNELFVSKGECRVEYATVLHLHTRFYVLKCTNRGKVNYTIIYAQPFFTRQNRSKDSKTFKTLFYYRKKNLLKGYPARMKRLLNKSLSHQAETIFMAERSCGSSADISTLQWDVIPWSTMCLAVSLQLSHLLQLCLWESSLCQP